MKKIDIKLGKNFKDFWNKIKPKSSKNLKKKKISMINEILFGLIKGQKCFLNTIVKNTKNYEKSLKNFQNWIKSKKISKIPQIAKLSNYLDLNFNKFKEKFLKNIWKNLELKSFEELKSKTIKKRIFEQTLALHDTTDIQKPFAKKMQKVAKTRDWSKHKSWKWYYIEWAIFYVKGKIIPLLLTLFSSKEETDSKKITRKNLDFLKTKINFKNIINIFDRGYDTAIFIKNLIKKWELFIIRWVKNRGVICPKYYEKIKWKWTSKLDRQSIFSKVEDFTKEIKFQKIATYKHYDVGFKKIFRKGKNADKNLDDVISVNLVVIRLKKDSDILWIEEDLQTFKNAWEDFDREFYFYTNLNIETSEDALVIFYLYLKRWNIEVYFKYLKQVFDLEKIKILNFRKLENMCNLLVLTSYFLYDNFYKVLNKFNNLSKKSLENILIEEEKEKNSLELFILKYYFQYSEQENLDFNPDSFSKFIHFEMWNNIIYCEKIFNESW